MFLNKPDSLVGVKPFRKNKKNKKEEKKKGSGDVCITVILAYLSFP